MNRIPMALVVGLLLALQQVPAAGQRAPFATPPPGSGPTPMRPFGQSGGCSEEPAQFHRCAMEKAKTFMPPRTPDGHPNLQGYWSRIGIRNMENIEEHPETMDGSGGTSSIIDPPDGRIPYQPWAAAKREGHFSTYRSPVRYCVPHGSPAQSYLAGGFQVVQTPGHVVILNEYSHTYRIIPTDGRPHVGPGIRLLEGDSRGRWEGNTLVIDVTNLTDKTWLDHIGNFYSESVHVVERFTMIHPDVLHYQATIDDPKVFARPWTMTLGWRRNAEPGYELWENACWEGVNQGDLDRVNIGLKVYPGAFAK